MMNNLQQDFLDQSIETIENLILRLQNETNREVFSENFRREAFRALHTIKGTAQTFGFPVSGNLAHELETLLSTDENRQISADENRKSFFLEGLRLLKTTFEQKSFEIPAVFTEKIRRAAPVENDQETFLSEIPTSIVSQLSSREKNVVDSALRAGKNLFCLEIDFDLAKFADGLTDFREVISEKCEIVATLPGAKFNLQDKIGFQILAAASESRKNIENVARKYSAEVVFQTAPRKFSNDLRGVLEQAAAHGENLAKQLGKKINFEISDEAAAGKIEIPARLLKIIFDALLHLVRNAIDHGIETPTERTAQNKKARARIKIQFSTDANNFYLKVSDDGRGIDTEKIRAKAIEKNLIGASENLPEQSLEDLIFAPEFSTAERITQISGRGVGLDAVKDAVEKTGGKITVKSEKEKGTTFEIFLPKEN
ncbi:MAG TPA: ATP-binding protein [Pyrinomonadaceae bacterium]|nr:ATP-binding protein [Pyrinomonadaceae bacterium]